MRIESQFMVRLVALALIGQCLADVTRAGTETAELRNPEDCAYLEYHPDYVADPTATTFEAPAEAYLASASVKKKRASLKNGISKYFASKAKKFKKESPKQLLGKLLLKSSDEGPVDGTSGDTEYDTDDETDDEEPTVPDYTESDTFGFDFGADLDFSIEDPQDMKDYFEREYYDKQKEKDIKGFDYFDILDDVANYEGDDDYGDLELEEQEAEETALLSSYEIQARKVPKNVVNLKSSMRDSSQSTKFVQFPDEDSNSSAADLIAPVVSNEGSTEDTTNPNIRIIGEPSNLVPLDHRVRAPAIQSNGVYDSEDEDEEGEEENERTSLKEEINLGTATRISVGAPAIRTPTIKYTPRPTPNISPTLTRIPLITTPASMATTQNSPGTKASQGPVVKTRASVEPTSRVYRGRPPPARQPGATTVANSTRSQNSAKPYPYLFFKDSLSEKLSLSYATLLIVPIVVGALL